MSYSRRGFLRLFPLAAPLSMRAWQSFYTGKNEPLPRQMELSAGPLTMVFEPELGFLRYLRYGETEVIRGIYAAVRDRNWGTVAPRISNVRLESAEAGFRLRFDVACKEGDIDFLWHGEISGTAAGRVQFAMDGTARATFLRNRIGFCVLHPVKGCAGEACTVRHSDGREEKGKFPLSVSPNQPFKDMVSVFHGVGAGVTAEVAFEGDTFEMEDHRNWTDGSYKTYCTPLEKPYPVEVKSGDRVRQSVTVSLRGARAAQAPAFLIRRKEVSIAVDSGSARQLPSIGIGFGVESTPLDTKAHRRLLAMRPAHVRVDWKAGDLIPAVDWPLELVLHLTDNAEAELQQVAAFHGKVSRYLVFHQKEKSTSGKWVTLARQRLKGAPVGAGTNAYFAELNRERPDAGLVDFVCFSVNPQVHAFDNASLVENAAAQADAVESARLFAGSKGVVVSPITFKPRFNPNATGGEAVVAADVLPPFVDSRQVSLFGAAWTVASVKYVSEGGAQAVTYYDAVGPRGVMETTAGSRWPQLFPSKAGQVYPLYHVLADVCEFAGGEVQVSRSSEPLKVDAVVMRKGGRTRALVANLTSEAQTVRLAWGGGKRVSIRHLDEHSVEAATSAPESWREKQGDVTGLGGAAIGLSLPAYGVARIDSSLREADPAASN